MITAEFWVQLRAIWWAGGSSLKEVRAGRITQRRPDQPEPGCVVMKMTVHLPVNVFVPTVWQGSVTVPPDRLMLPPPTVTADPP